MTLRELSILIADDNEMNRWLLAEQLQNWSQDITVAADGREAWQALQRQCYALVFLDVNMPGLTGFELVKKTRAASLNQASPIIAVTAHVQSYQRHRLLDDGFNDCLIKPVVLADLQRVIAEWCGTSQTLGAEDYAGVVLEKVEHNRELGRLFLQKLFREAPVQFSALAQALHSQQRVPALEIAHKLHGSFCFYGFADFRALAEKLEKDLEAADMPAAAQQFSRLSEKFEQLIQIQSEVLAHF